MNHRTLSHACTAAAVLAVLAWPSLALAAGPATVPAEILREGFEVGTQPSYLAGAPVGAGSTAYWAPHSNRAYAGSRSLWCAGSKPTAWAKYPSGTNGYAVFDATGTADYYESQIDIAYTMPSRGAWDTDSFFLQWYEPTQSSALPHYLSQLTTLGGWRFASFSLTDQEDPNALSRRAGRFQFQFQDRLEIGASPATGEGPSVDEVFVRGWKYGIPRSLRGTSALGSVELRWARPYRSTAATSTEERPITYRVWVAPGASTSWTELTSSRLVDSSTEVAFAAPVPGENSSFRYAVQAWDSGAGSGYGRPSMTTVTVPASAPIATITAPAAAFEITSTPIQISGSATDTGSGVASVDVSIWRSDGRWWSGSGWVNAETWLPASSADGWSSWSKSWMPDAETINGGTLVVISARATDKVGLRSETKSVSSRTPPPPFATTVSIARKASTIAYATRASIVGTLTSLGSPAAGQRVVLRTGASSTSMKDSSYAATTSATGTYAFNVPISSKTYFAVRLPASSAYQASASTTTTVMPKAYVGTPAAPSSVRRYRAFTVAGSLKPKHSSGLSAVRLYFDRYERQGNGSYKWVQRKAVYAKTSNSNSWSYTRYAVSTTLSSTGKWRVRGYHSDAAHPATYSGYDYLTVLP